MAVFVENCLSNDPPPQSDAGKGRVRAKWPLNLHIREPELRYISRPRPMQRFMHQPSVSVGGRQRLIGLVHDPVDIARAARARLLQRRLLPFAPQPHLQQHTPYKSTAAPAAAPAAPAAAPAAPAAAPVALPPRLPRASHLEQSVPAHRHHPNPPHPTPPRRAHVPQATSSRAPLR